MKCLSFNCKGMVSSPKNLALRRLFESEPVDIIFLQEALGEANHINSILESLEPRWDFFSLDAVRRSARLALGYNPHSIHLKSAWGGKGFIGIDIFSTELGKDLRVINFYGPCQGREVFWNQLPNLSITSTNNLIIGGDLSFSIGFCESWGSLAQIDLLSDTMENLLDQAYLTDIPMNRPLPTWRNRRVGEVALAKRLDRFILKTLLIQHLSHYRQWVGLGGISDHSPIYLEITSPSINSKAPFKFNLYWLHDPSYSKLVSYFWLEKPLT